MEALPNEILGDIVQFLDRPDLCSLRLVDTRLRDVATRLAFRQLKVYETEPSARRFNSLVHSNNSLILRAVETLTFDGCLTDYYDLGAEPALPMLKDAFDSLSRLSNLRTLHIDFFEGSWPEYKADYFSYFVDIQLEIWRSLENASLPRLQTLSIGRMITHFPRILSETDPFLALFRTLDTLSLSVVSLAHPLQDFVPEGILRFNDTLSSMLTAARNITSLELGLYLLLSPSIEPFAFEALVFPALTALSLHNIMLQGAPDPDPDAPPSPDPPLEIPDEGPKFTAETFILNHSATLQHLALYNCAVSALHGVWHRVFNRFGAQLPGLIEFTLMTSVSGLTFPYARDIRRGRYRVMPSIHDNPQDVAALEHFQNAVMFRRNSMAFDPVPTAGLKSRFRCPPRSAIFGSKGRQMLNVTELLN